MLRTGLLVICVVLAASTFGEAAIRQIHVRSVDAAGKSSVESRVVMNGPSNVAAIIGAQITLSCQTTPGDRTQWVEYGQTPAGGIISDNGTITGPYPRYSMSNDPANGWFNLTINPTALIDGGLFRCRDEVTFDYLQAEVIVLDSAPNCTNTIPVNNVIILGVYYTITCVITYGGSEWVNPSTRWVGNLDYNFGQSNGTNANGTRIITSGLSFIAQKSHDGSRFSMVTYFDQRYFGTFNGSATNVPTYTSTYNAPLVFVQYGPWNMSVTPDKVSYEIGEVLTCYADARPLPNYLWTNMQNANQYQTQTLVLTAAMVGTYTWRCQVSNTWGTQNYFRNVTVNPVTTPTPSPVPTTTTPIPAVQNCKDISGKWTSTRTDGTQAVLCLYVNTTANGGITGWLMNNTQLGNMMQLVGATRNTLFDEIGLVGVWQGDLGVSAMAAECHNCYGVEKMIVDVVSRTELDDLTCGDGGALRRSEEYGFSRSGWDVGSSGYCYSNV